MDRITVIILLLLLSFDPAVSQEPAAVVNRSETIEYINDRPYHMHAVLQGQTLYGIARAYGVTQQDIIRENPDLEDGLRYDQIIRIPVIEEQPESKQKIRIAAPDPEGTYIEHRVRRRETLFGLSQKYSISIERILYYNPEARGGLQVGQVLKIPVEAAAVFDTDKKTDITSIDDTDYILYHVPPGATLYGITREFDIPEEALFVLNPDLEDGLKAGMRIRIPLQAAVQTAESEKPGPYITVSRPSPDADIPAAHDECFDFPVNESYKVALLLPLYLEELLEETDDPDSARFGEIFELQNLNDTGDVQDYGPKVLKDRLEPGHKSFAFLSYYHGVLIALDSIRAEGVDITLHVHDVCQDIDKAIEVTEMEGFKDFDLIIGPFHRQPLNHIAEHGRRYGIPVVSPLLPDNRQLQDLPNLIKSTPALETMLDGVSTHISQNYPHQNIIIVHNQQPGAAALIEAFKDTLLTQVALVNAFHDSLNLARIQGYYFDDALVGSRQTNLIVMPDTVSVMIPVSVPSTGEISLPRPYNVQEVIFRYEGMEGVLKKMRPDRENILVTLISGEPFLSDYLRQLHTKRHHYDISVFGIQEWQEYSSIEIDYFQNLKVHIFSPSFYDYRDVHIQDFVYRYRRMFHTEPNAEAFKAAQNAYFFFDALNRFGRNFKRCFALLDDASIESPFLFRQPFGPDNGWENQHFHITRIRNYQWVDVRRPLEIARSAN